MNKRRRYKAKRRRARALHRSQRQSVRSFIRDYFTNGPRWRAAQWQLRALERLVGERDIAVLVAGQRGGRRFAQRIAENAVRVAGFTTQRVGSISSSAPLLGIDYSSGVDWTVIKRGERWL